MVLMRRSVSIRIKKRKYTGGSENKSLTEMTDYSFLRMKLNLKESLQYFCNYEMIKLEQGTCVAKNCFAFNFSTIVIE